MSSKVSLLFFQWSLTRTVTPVLIFVCPFVCCLFIGHCHFYASVPLLFLFYVWGITFFLAMLLTTWLLAYCVTVTGPLLNSGIPVTAGSDAKITISESDIRSDSTLLLTATCRDLLFADRLIKHFLNLFGKGLNVIGVHLSVKVPHSSFNNVSSVIEQHFVAAAPGRASFKGLAHPKCHKFKGSGNTQWEREQYNNWK